jgi:hypothetical protein
MRLTQKDTTMDFNRDRYGRPLIDVDGKPTPYTRISSYGQILEDQTGLNRWKLRMVVAGVAQRPDLVALASAHAHDDRKLDSLAQQLLDAGGASKAANTGTAIHEVLAQVDQGSLSLDAVPDSFMQHAVAWQQCIADFGLEVIPELVEIPLVNDRYEAAGSSDNFLMRTTDGLLVVVDKKTGKSISSKPLAYMVQLALYATSMEYKIETGERIALPPVDLNIGYIAHLPANSDTCTMYEVNLRQALDLADLAQKIKQAQKSNIKVSAAAPTVVLNREMLVRRIEAIRDAGHAAQLANIWPSGVPTLKSSDKHSLADLREISAAVALIERNFDMPFMPVEVQQRPQPQKRTAAKVKPAKERPVEGDDMDKPTIDFLRKHIKAQPDHIQKRLAQWAKEASTAGNSVSLSAKPSQRRFEIARLMLALANVEEPATVLGVYTEMQDTIGGTLATLTTKQAHDLCAQVEEHK